MREHFGPMTRRDERGPPIELDTEALARLASALDIEPVVSAELFGSYASGRPGPLSDVDVAVWLDPDLDSAERFAARLRLLDSAAAALGTEEVDLVVLNDAPPLLQHRARRGAIRLVDRDAPRRVRFEADALVRYLDTAPLRQELARGLEHRLEEERFGRP
jgi:predicted nucleotidyltransferase